MLLPSAVYVSSTFEFVAMIHDCLSADPQGNPPFSPSFGAPSMLLPSAVHVFSPIFSEPHECYCLALFMCPPPSSLELCFMIA